MLASCPLASPEPPSTGAADTALPSTGAAATTSAVALTIVTVPFPSGAFQFDACTLTSAILRRNASSPHMSEASSMLLVLVSASLYTSSRPDLMNSMHVQASPFFSTTELDMYGMNRSRSVTWM